MVAVIVLLGICFGALVGVVLGSRLADPAVAVQVRTSGIPVPRAHRRRRAKGSALTQFVMTLLGPLLVLFVGLYVEYHSGLFQEPKAPEAVVRPQAPAFPPAQPQAQAPQQQPPAPSPASPVPQPAPVPKAPLLPPNPAKEKQAAEPATANPPAQPGAQVKQKEQASAPPAPPEKKAKDPAQPAPGQKPKPPKDAAAREPDPPQAQPREPAARSNRPAAAQELPAVKRAPQLAPKQRLALRFRPCTIRAHLLKADTRAFKKALDKLGIEYRETADVAPVNGPYWFTYYFVYKWHDLAAETPEELAALRGELEGLRQRFKFGVEISE